MKDKLYNKLVLRLTKQLKHISKEDYGLLALILLDSPLCDKICAHVLAEMANELDLECSLMIGLASQSKAFKKYIKIFRERKEVEYDERF